MKTLFPFLCALLLWAPDVAASEPDSSALDRIRGLIEGRRYEEAEDAARALLAREGEETSADHVRILDSIVFAMIRTGRAAEPECGELARRSLRIKEKLHGKDSPAIVSGLINLGEHLRNRQEFREAESVLERALRIRERHLGANDAATSHVVGLLADLHVETGHYDEARRMFERQVRAVEETAGPDSPELVPVLYRFAGLAARTADYGAAKELYGRALVLARAEHGEDHPSVAYLLNGLAIVHDEANEYDEARDAYEDAIRIAEGTMGETSPFVGSCLNNLGYLLKNLGDLDGAKRLYEKALRVHRANYGEKHGYVASTLWNLGEVCRSAGDIEHALRLNEQALAIREEVLGPDHPEVATSLWTIGGLLIDSGDAETALPLLQRALGIRREALGEKHHHTAEVVQAIGRAQLAVGNAAEAAARYAEARRGIEAALGPENPRNAPILLGQARAAARLGRYEQALHWSLEAERVSREHTRLTAATLPERQALQYSAIRTAGLDLALSLVTDGLCPGRVPETWTSLIRSRALVLDELARRRTALGGRANAEVERLSREHAAASERLAELLVRGPDGDGDYRSALDEARRAMEASERRLAKRSASFRRVQDRREVGWDEVAGTLGSMPSASLVAYARYRHEDTGGPSEAPGELRYVAFVGDGTSPPVAVSLGSASHIEEAIGRWAREVAGPGHGAAEDLAAYRAAGEQVRKVVWDPVAPHVRGSARVFAVPDGLLHRLSLATLPVGPSDYLIEGETRFHYLSAERDLIFAAEDTAACGKGMLVVGGVDFDAAEADGFVEAVDPAAADRPEPDGALPGVRFEELPASDREAREIARAWNERMPDGPADTAIVLTGPRATERAVKKACEGSRIVHLATHAFVLGSAPRGAHGARGIGALAPAPAAAPGGGSSLRLSGIVLAGANHHRSGAGEDGILAAEEIAALDLSRVDWVVLSACDTGLGQVQTGEGVLGLRRAFEVAGARTLVMSLWSVEDEPARRWMESLYAARLNDGSGTAECVRRASLEALAFARRKGGSDHPSRWGAFVAVGGWQ